LRGQIVCISVGGWFALELRQPADGNIKIKGDDRIGDSY
jgi:hypothetical protein